jgi:hypothetical protein
VLPIGKNSSGSSSRQAERERQSMEWGFLFQYQQAVCGRSAEPGRRDLGTKV